MYWSLLLLAAELCLTFDSIGFLRAGALLAPAELLHTVLKVLPLDASFQQLTFCSQQTNANHSFWDCRISSAKILRFQ